MNQQWTFETLATATRPVLEQVLRQGTAPDLNRLNGFSYCGYNHEPIGKLTGQKFKKGFFSTGGVQQGYNEQVQQDRLRFKGNWITKPSTQMGYFRVCYLNDTVSNHAFAPYQHLALFDYGVDQLQWHHGYFKLIRDIIALPNPGDHSLLLGKAYLQFSRSITVFCCYFILGYPQPNAYAPAAVPVARPLMISAGSTGSERSLQHGNAAVHHACKNYQNCTNRKCLMQKERVA